MDTIFPKIWIQKVTVTKWKFEYLKIFKNDCGQISVKPESLKLKPKCQTVGEKILQRTIGKIAEGTKTAVGFYNLFSFL